MVRGDVFYIGKSFWFRTKDIPVRFRVDPVPHTGKNSWRFRCYYKTRMNVMPEKRALATAKEWGVRVRGKRNKRLLPDPWDDVRRGDSWNAKSWKKMKKKRQWM